VPIQVEPPLVAFEDNDRDYLYWTSQNARGYVVNCYRDPSSDYLKLHWADCYTINGNQLPWTTNDYAIRHGDVMGEVTRVQLSRRLRIGPVG